MDPYTTSKSNLAPQDFDKETLTALRLPSKEAFQALLKKLDEQNQMKEAQRTGNFFARAVLQPGAEITQLQALFHQMGTLIQKATDDGRTYEFEVKMVTFVTVEPMQAEVGEYVSPVYFDPNPDNTQDQVLESQDVHEERRVFQPTPQGYQRIE